MVTNKDDGRTDEEREAALNFEHFGNSNTVYHGKELLASPSPCRFWRAARELLECLVVFEDGLAGRPVRQLADYERAFVGELTVVSEQALEVANRHVTELSVNGEPIEQVIDRLERIFTTFYHNQETEQPCEDGTESDAVKTLRQEVEDVLMTPWLHSMGDASPEGVVAIDTERDTCWAGINAAWERRDTQVLSRGHGRPTARAAAMWTLCGYWGIADRALRQLLADNRRIDKKPLNRAVTSDIFWTRILTKWGGLNSEQAKSIAHEVVKLAEENRTARPNGPLVTSRDTRQQ